MRREAIEGKAAKGTENYEHYPERKGKTVEGFKVLMVNTSFDAL